MTSAATDSRDMIIIHSVFRRELSLAPDLIDAVADGDTDRSAVVSKHLLDLLDLLHHHHEGEDELLWPILRERAPSSDGLFNEMSADHHSIDGPLTAVRTAVEAWGKTADKTAGHDVSRQLRELTPPLFDHLDREEARILPLVDSHLSPEEWGRLGERGFGALAPDKALIVLGQMAEDTPDDVWTEFLSHLPEPVQQAYWNVGVNVYADYVRQVRNT